MPKIPRQIKHRLVWEIHEKVVTAYPIETSEKELYTREIPECSSVERFSP